MIKINDNLIIDADDNQFIVKQVRTVQDPKSKNKGKQIYDVWGYYITLEGALRGVKKLLQRRTVRDKDVTLKTLLDEIKKIHEDIFNKCGG